MESSNALNSRLSPGEFACVALISVSRDVGQFGFVPRVKELRRIQVEAIV